MATTYYKSTTAGEWGVAASWDLHSGHAGGDGIPAAGDTVYFDASSAACTIAGTSACLTLDQTGYAATLTHNALRVLTVSGNLKLVAGGYTAAADSATIIIDATATLTTGGCLLGSLTFNKVGGTLSLGDNLAFRADKTTTLNIIATTLNLNGYTISGNSAVNRLLVKSGTLGTAKTITDSTGAMTTADFANCDFQDITFTQTTSGNLDFQGDGVLAGDCGGNTQTGGGTLTLTTGTTQTFTYSGGGDGLWNTAANWTSHVPLPQDTVVMGNLGANGRTIAVNMPRYGGDVSFAGATTDGSTPVTSLTVTMNTTGLTYTNYGDLDLTRVTTFTHNKATYFQGRLNATLTMNGRAFGATATVSLAGGAGNNTFTVSDALTVTGSTLAITVGNLTAASTISCNTYTASSGTSTDLGDSTWTISGASGTPWGMSGTVSDAGASTIALTGTASTATTFAGGANIYNDIVISPSATNVLTFSGAFTFANMTMASAGAKTVKWTSGTTYKMSGDNFLEGSAAGNVTLTSTDTSQWTLDYTGSPGPVECSYLTIDYCTVDASTNWYAGATPPSVDSGHNGATTWTFATASAAVVIADALAFADVLSDHSRHVASFADALSLADVVTLSSSHSATIADTLGLADVLAAKSAHAVTAADSLAVSDSLIALSGFIVTLDDTLTAADVASMTSRFTFVAADALGIADSLGAASAHFVALDDGITIADVLTATDLAGKFATLADTLTFSDTLTTHLRFVPTTLLFDVSRDTILVRVDRETLLQRGN